jgi:hypothetical protein
MFNDTVLKEIDSIRERFPDRKSAILPSLYIAGSAGGNGKGDSIFLFDVQTQAGWTPSHTTLHKCLVHDLGC